MKKQILTLCLLISVLLMNAQFVHMDLTKYKIDKNETTAVLLSNDKVVDELLMKAVKSSWTATKYIFITYEDAIKGNLNCKYYINMGYRVSYGEKNSSGNGMDLTRAIGRLSFGIINPELNTYIEKYKMGKIKDVQKVYDAISGINMAVFMDPYNIDYRMIPINIKTLNWMATTDMLKYMPNGYSDDYHAITSYNANQSKLKNTTVLINKDYTKTGSKLDATCKGFNLTECKADYKGKVEIKSMEEINTILDNINSDKQYAILIHGINERTQTTFIYSLNTGEVICGFDIAMSSSPGFTKTWYKIFGEKYNGN